MIITNVESCDMWHPRLGQINSNFVRRMMSLNLIPKSSIDFEEKKCEMCSIKATKEPMPYMHEKGN